MNVKKMFASLAGVLMLAQAAAPMVTGAATYSDELQGAYDYAYSVGITTMSSIDNANMYWDLTRGQLSKMISQWAEKEMGVKADTTAVCSFTDTDTAEGDLATYVVKSCQMGLMGQGIEKFRPNDKVTRGEFGTVLSRAIWGDKYDGENPYYAKHLQALKDAGIMTNISDPNATEMRGWVMLMLERAAETVNPSECNDPAVLLACSLGSDSCPAACQKDAEETTVDDNGNVIKVKSGDLQISAAAAEGRKVALNGGISDLDTITLKASEAITLNSVTLERFGFSSYKDVANIWLENSNGVKIANEKSISSTKDTVTLNIKKEYRELNSEDTITVVLETNKFEEDTICKINDVKVSCPSDKYQVKPATTEISEVEDTAHAGKYACKYDGVVVMDNLAQNACATKLTNGDLNFVRSSANTTYSVSNAGSTIGFKVTSVDSSAKNLNIDNYNPYLYDMVTYDSSKVSVTVKGKDSTYHYVDGNAYEVARFQVKAGNAAVAVNGFTLTNDGSYGANVSNVDLDKFVDNVIVTLGDGTKLSNVRFDANKDDELKVSFDEVEVAINKNVIFVVEVVFKDFDDYGKAVVLQLKETWDLNVVEKKTGARATVEAAGIVMHKYLFQGGKIEVTNTKLADTIDASAGSTNITVGKGKINIWGESIELNKFTITADHEGIESLKMLVNGDEYEAKAVADWFEFDKITIDENSDIEFTVDIKDPANKVTISLGSFDRTTLQASSTKNPKTLGRYEDARSDITAADWAGSISLSKVRIQAAKWSLSAGSTKDVEILEKQTARKTIYEGTYTATKQDVYLNGFAVRQPAAEVLVNWSDVTYYLSVDGKEVGSFDYTAGVAATITDEEYIAWDKANNLSSHEQWFSDVLVKNGEKVSIKLEANVYWVIDAGHTSEVYAPTLIIRGTDKDGNPAGLASDATSKIKIVSAGSVTVSENPATPKESVEVADNNVTIASFIVKSSKNTEWLTLKSFTLTPDTGATPLAQANTRVRVAWTDLVVGDEFTVDGNGVVSVNDTISEDIPSAGVTVEVIARVAAANANYKYTLTSVNNSQPGTKFAKKILASVASIKSQENRGNSTTKFTFAVDKDDNDVPVKNLVLFHYDNTLSTPAYVALNTNPLSTVEEGTTLEITNGDKVRFVDAIVWWEKDDGNGGKTACVAADIKATPTAGCIVITKSEFRDFFKVGDAEAQVFRTSN